MAEIIPLFPRRAIVRRHPSQALSCFYYYLGLCVQLVSAVLVSGAILFAIVGGMG